MAMSTGLVEPAVNKEKWEVDRAEDAPGKVRTRWHVPCCPVDSKCKTWGTTGRAWSYEGEYSVRQYAKHHLMTSKLVNHELPDDEADEMVLALVVEEHEEDFDEREAYRVEAEKRQRAKELKEANAASQASGSRSGPIRPVSKRPRLAAAELPLPGPPADLPLPGPPPLLQFREQEVPPFIPLPQNLCSQS